MSDIIKPMNLSIYICFIFCFSNFQTNGAEILELITKNINKQPQDIKSKNKNIICIPTENYRSYGSIICSRTLSNHYLNNYYIYVWHMEFISSLGKPIYEYFITIKQKKLKGNISIFNNLDKITINNILEQKPVAIYYSKNTNQLIVMFIHDDNFSIVHFNVENKDSQYIYKKTDESKNFLRKI